MTYTEITISTAYKEIKQHLPELDARLLLQHAINISREDLILKKDDKVTNEEHNKIKSFTKRRLNGEPVSRIIGTREFYGLDFMLSSETLDPRPDTETLIETILKHKDNPPENCRILDLGTGTGCIILTLLSKIPHATGVAIDISKQAIQTATMNAENLKLNSRCEFISGSWKDNNITSQIGTFDIIVSNPPYIPAKDILNLATEVKDHDPIKALDGGEDGLDCYRDLAILIPSLLSNTGICVFEIGYNQAEDVTNILKNASFAHITVEKDLGKKNRCILATKNQQTLK